jgi:hypothetical protein
MQQYFIMYPPTRSTNTNAHSQTSFSNPIGYLIISFPILLLLGVTARVSASQTLLTR